MTAAEELTAAADKLDALAGGATLELASVEYLEGVLFPEDLAYVAAMNPLVGEALAEWLRSEATAARGGEGRGFGGADLYRVNPRALALVRLINGTQSAES